VSFSVAAFTLGCKVNQYDTDAILRDFAALGFTVCDFDAASEGSRPDVYIINTCTVTNISEKKSRQMISRAHKKNPQALIVAYGCYAQMEPEVLKNLPGVSMVLGAEKKHRVAETVAAHLNDIKVVGLQEAGRTKVAAPYQAKRTRAHLKVQDGCDRYCSYCIVPYARGAVKSRTIAEAMTEAEALVKSGCKEIVITGIQIASYGNDLNNTDDLITLIKCIHDIPGLERLRLGSLEPSIITKEFLQIAGRLPKLCDHFHLSLQSGCDRTLKRMNRRYSTNQYAQVVADVRSYFPQGALTTDIIVGFPGETEEDFAESLAFAQNIGFFRIHVFAYSPRAGTPAADFPNQIGQTVKEHRSRAMRRLAEKMNHEFYERCLGQVFPVLIESEIEKGLWEGHTPQYLTVRVSAEEDLNNCIVDVMLESIQNGAAYGVLHGSYIKGGC